MSIGRMKPKKPRHHQHQHHDHHWHILLSSMISVAFYHRRTEQRGTRTVSYRNVQCYLSQPNDVHQTRLEHRRGYINNNHASHTGEHQTLATQQQQQQ